MTRIKVDKKIVGYDVEVDTTQATAEKPVEKVETSRPEESKVIRMHERLERPDMLVGSTYKVKTPVSDHAMYVTINDIVLNEGTDFEKRRPFEIFINSKNLDHYQWIVALTRIMSAVFRKGGDVNFLVEELKAVFDPRGGYWQPGGRYMPSIIAELGYIVERHLTTIGLLQPVALTDEQQRMLDEKRAEFEARDIQKDAFSEPRFPEGAQLCTKCSTAAAVMMDGCMTCLSCGYSKCG
ncbi:MAG TPA: NrdJb [Gammaproteobacteria bacterium]